MTTLLLVFVCLQVITAADSVELSGTCPGHGKAGLSHVLHSGPIPKDRQPPEINVPEMCTHKAPLFGWLLYHSLSLIWCSGSQGDSCRFVGKL